MKGLFGLIAHIDKYGRILDTVVKIATAVAKVVKEKVDDHKQAEAAANG